MTSLAHKTNREDLDDEIALNPMFTRAAEFSVPKYTLPDGEMLPQMAYQIIHDELMLDGNARMNLATFVTTWMEPQAEKLMAECFDKNMIDKDEYPRTAELEQRCVHILADLWHAPGGPPTGCSTTGSSEACMLAGLGAEPVEVRTPGQLTDRDALVIPGGESTTMTLGIKREGLADPLREFVRSARPVLRTCGWVLAAAMRCSFVPGTRWSTSTPSRRCGAGPKARTASARSLIRQPPRRVAAISTRARSLTAARRAGAVGVGRPADPPARRPGVPAEPATARGGGGAAACPVGALVGVGGVGGGGKPGRVGPPHGNETGPGSGMPPASWAVATQASMSCSTWSARPMRRGT